MGDDISEKYRSDHSKNSYSKKALDFTYIGLANCMSGLPDSDPVLPGKIYQHNNWEAIMVTL